MKTKVLLLLSITGLLMMSCLKEYSGGGIEEVELTDSNYIYEGHLYEIYLEQEIEKLDVEIQLLEDIVANNQADQTTLDQLAAAKKESYELSSEIENIFSFDELAIRIPRPKPPCPTPLNCDFTLLENILTNNFAEKITLEFQDKNGKVIGGGTIDELSPLPETGGEILFSKINISSFDGLYSIAVEVIEKDGLNKRSYIVYGK